MVRLFDDKITGEELTLFTRDIKILDNASEIVRTGKASNLSYQWDRALEAYENVVNIISKIGYDSFRTEARKSEPLMNYFKIVEEETPLVLEGITKKMGAFLSNEDRDNARKYFYLAFSSYRCFGDRFEVIEGVKKTLEESVLDVVNVRGLRTNKELAQLAMDGCSRDPEKGARYFVEGMANGKKRYLAKNNEEDRLDAEFCYFSVMRLLKDFEKDISETLAKEGWEKLAGYVIPLGIAKLVNQFKQKTLEDLIKIVRFFEGKGVDVVKYSEVLEEFRK